MRLSRTFFRISLVTSTLAARTTTSSINTDEFTMGASTETSVYGVTKNPYDLERVAGGSSGGSAASVAAGMAMYSLATDTGGSIRQPATFCGVPGLKVTYGRVSRHGAMSMASSLDTIGPIAKSVEDLAIVLGVIAGHDKKDSTTPKVEVPDYVKGLDKDIKGLKIGVPKEYFIEGLSKYSHQLNYLRLFDSGKIRYSLLKWARRHGKSTMCFNLLIRS